MSQGQEVIRVSKPIKGSKGTPKWTVTDVNNSRYHRVAEANIPHHVKERMRDVQKAHFLGTYISTTTGWSISSTIVADPGW